MEQIKEAVSNSCAERTLTEKNDSDPIPEFSKLSIASAFEEELKVPKPVEWKKTVKMPSYLSGQEMIDMLEKKKSKEKLRGMQKDCNVNERKKKRLLGENSRREDEKQEEEEEEEEEGERNGGEGEREREN